MSSQSLVNFEAQVLHEKFVGIVLRYGRFYGPNTGVPNPIGSCKVHVDAAAYAALLVIENGAAGIYNIAEDDGNVSIRKVINELHWDPAYRFIPG